MKGYGEALRNGMTVFSADGHKLGTIVRCDADGFIIEKGIFFPKDYVVRHADIARNDGDDVWLSVNKEALVRVGDRADDETLDTDVTRRDFDATGAGAIDAPGGPSRAARDDVRVQAVEEQLEAHTRVREGGDVVIRKEVVTEEKQITVPVTREEVHIERHAVNRPAAPGVRIEEDTIRVPVREEEVEIRKRPVVREEVRVSKTPHVEHRVASETVRREEIDVDEGAGDRRPLRDPDDKKIV